MIYTIKDLREGKVAVTNDGTLEQLEVVLKAAFPEDTYNWNDFEKEYSKYHSFCKNQYVRTIEWYQVSADKELSLPIQSVKEFYKQLQPQFEADCWYYIELGVYKWYFKVKEVKKESVTILESINILDKEYLHDSDYCKRFGDDNNFTLKEITKSRKLTDLSEIQQYLPDNHPDKIKTMKQYLTRKQLIELYKADSCMEWKSKIKSILEHDILATDDTKFEIIQPMIDYVNSKCSKEQKELLTKAGLVLKQELAVRDSKDGDCIKVGDYYYVNRNEIVILFMYNSVRHLQPRHADLKCNISPDIKGTLVKEPLELLIKIN